EQPDAPRSAMASLGTSRRTCSVRREASVGVLGCWGVGVLGCWSVGVLAPAYTRQDCSVGGARVQKSLSIRTHGCLCPGLVLDRDQHAARNIHGRGQCLRGLAGVPAGVNRQPAGLWPLRSVSLGFSVLERKEVLGTATRSRRVGRSGRRTIWGRG